MSELTQVNGIFGPIKIGPQVETAVLETLRKWFPTYLQAVEVQQGRRRGEIPVPRLYTNRNRFEAFPADQMPMCIVVSPGLVDSPVVDSSGRYQAWWAVGVGMIAGANDDQAASYLAKLYIAVARAILLHKQGMPDEDGNSRSSGVIWEDESYDDEVVPHEERTIRAAYAIFRVGMEDVTAKWMGPDTPIDVFDDLGTLSIVEEVIIHQTKVGIDQEV